eukprot:2698065-Lingulodinium_polyedra.AAC.1
MELTKALVRFGFHAVGTDKLYHGSLAYETPLGLRANIVYLRFVRPGNAIHWLGVECKSYVWVGRRQTGRSHSNLRGFERSSDLVRRANL